MANLVFKPETKTAHYFTEQLSDDVGLDMIWVPSGEFDMGSAEDDSEGYSDERPQHRVTVSGFFMGRYPVTQAQWRAVVAMPQQSQSLDPDPSNFKGDKHPVESVNWYNAVEFCDRLSQHIGRTYRLPSEAEWEYACRAQTLTPFYFGNQLTSDLANFAGSGESETGENREGTTPVDQYPYANGFGLSDMHGNVWEWCLDHWHDSYEGAPTDGSAWLDEEAEEDKSRVFRGGAWDYDPWGCRSAYRVNLNPRGSNNVIGFRVLCVAPRALT
ncbi:formylglycine-generating enzyme family protein [Oscillatoria sp. CS-180]|uniref:formylglycine-generating enzyme family protein n=1 Tax=Oscillatoria sp. CS-180 TaxID=3021720 RepID=UPI00232FC05D|nr:formylglycine-generating enzyme family protein [Oscillatoria sp. CS-180]MDB9526270.1 formylglycine-generating enzyme family protein [Oscillatoria sp. CS-180]